MTTRQISIELNAGTYFLTLTVQRWYYLFDRWEILANSLRYCQDHKALELNGYVFMLNHLHLIVSSADVAGFLCDFKRYTSKQLKDNIQANEPRVLEFSSMNQETINFGRIAMRRKKSKILIFYLQKLNYIHENPVRKGYVNRPEDWCWSSANPASALKVRFL